MTTTWRSTALECIEDLIDGGEPFSADDVIEECGLPDEDHTANSRNSGIGSLFSELSRSGRIKPVGVARSRQASRKGGMIRVWQAS